MKIKFGYFALLALFLYRYIVSKTCQLMNYLRKPEPKLLTIKTILPLFHWPNRHLKKLPTILTFPFS